MNAILLPAHFDGERIQLDEPFALQPNTRLLVTVLPDTEEEAWTRLSLNGLANAYSDQEPDYTLADIHKANADYERR